MNTAFKSDHRLADIMSPMLKISVLITLAAMLGSLVSCRREAAKKEGGGELAGTRFRSISTICLLEGKEYQTKSHVLDMLDHVRPAPEIGLIVTPFIPFLSFREGEEKNDLADFIKVAETKRSYLIVALAENAGDKSCRTAVILGPGGEILGKYRKTHRLAIDDEFDLGDDLPVFETGFGKIGIALTTDFCFPEVFEVLRMKGAEVLVWQDYPERFREHFQWMPLLYTRAMDSHAFLVTAHYADPRTYIANNYDYGMRGTAFGRSMVIDRSGTPRADTGYRHGIAQAILDLDEKKVDVYPMTPNFENLFYVPNNGGRAAFVPIAVKGEKPVLPKFKKRKARIAVAFTSGTKMWKDGEPPTAILELLDKAREFKPDLILFSENGARNPDDPFLVEGLQAIGRWAAENACYVVVGGIAGKDYNRSVARIWDRSGKIVYAQPIYWTDGFDDLKVLDTDFARIATHTCGDLFQFPIDRVLALKGAELILDPSQMWGPDGYHNELLLKARAIDNGCYIACSHWNTSDPGLRSVIIDPYGGVLAGSSFQRKGVIFADIDFSAEKIYYAGLRKEQPQTGENDIPNYFTQDLPEQLPGWRDMVFSNRRPELYSIIPTENEITRRYISKELQKKQKRVP